jgi:hypothetical protein
MITLTKNLKTLKKGESLSYLAGINRPVNPSHVTKLANSIDVMGVIRPVVVATMSFVTGKPTKYIIDGQHLFNALIRNNMPIDYVEIDVKNMTELVEKIALLNASSKTWVLTDYITAWCAIENDYVKLNHYFNVYDFELSMLAAVLANRSAKFLGGQMTKTIKAGSFRIENEAFNVAVLDDLTDVMKVFPRQNRVENRYVCSEYISFRRNNNVKYNHATFLKNLKAEKSKLVFTTSEEEKLTKFFQKLI